MLHRLATNVTARLVAMGMRRPRRVVWSVAGVVVMLGALMVRIEVDTDPENMLPSDHPVRELNQQMRADFGGGKSGDLLVMVDQRSKRFELTLPAKPKKGQSFQVMPASSHAMCRSTVTSPVAGSTSTTERWAPNGNVRPDG